MINSQNLKFFNKKKILITGHTGFKGSWLSAWLSYLNSNIYGFSIGIPTKPSNFEASNLKHHINDHRGDIKNLEALQELVKTIQPDIIFHFAAQALVRESFLDPVNTWETNTIGTVNLLESVRLIKNPCVVILITSDKAYQNNEWVWGYRETDILGGDDPYSASKAGAELAIKSYIKSFFISPNKHIKIGVARAGNVIGGGDWSENRIVPDCIKSWKSGKVVELRNPNATRPWQHVLEPLSGYLNLAFALHNSNNIHGEAFNFGPSNSSDYSVEELVCEMSKFWSQVQWASNKPDVNFKESSLLKLNCDKALNILKWKPVWDFEETVKETIMWYKNYYENGAESSYNFSISQIESYMKTAVNKGISWAI